MRRLPVTALALVSAACGVVETGPALDDTTDNFSSAEATLLAFEFDGTVYAGSSWSAQRQVEDQLLFTVGHMNGNRAVARLDRLEVTNVTTTADGSRTKIGYHAKLPVAWGSKTNLPASYELILPASVEYSALSEFTGKYKASCVDPGAHDVDAGSMFYYYRPKASGCRLADADVVRMTATATVSTENTTGKYPEYHEVWEDGRLEVVAIFGKYEDGATTGDAGITGYNSFLRAVNTALPGATTTPTEVGSNPGVGSPDVTFEKTLPDGKVVRVTALLVDNVRTAPAAFYERYEGLSGSADMIAYNGHAGLGENVRALARRGRFVSGKYLIVFMNGCDTYAYVDGSLAETRRALNPDDPTGSKYLEMVTNAMPSFFSSMPNASMALVKGLLKYDAPLTYEQIFANVDRSQVIIVTGEEDNVYVPGYDPGGGGGGAGEFPGMSETGSVDQNEELRYETPVVPAGTYVVAMSGTGDADLYVKVGAQPTRTAWDCRPYTSGTQERCVVELAQPGAIFVSIFGYSRSASEFTLDIRADGAPSGGGWAGMDESGTVAKDQELRYATPELAAGRYVFELTGSDDADLYVRVGSDPTTSTYDCRPYESSSNERCIVDLAAASTVHAMVRGYAASSTFRLVGRPE